MSGEWGLFPDDGTPHPPKLEFPPTASTLEEPSTPVDPNKLDGAIQEEVFELYEHDFEDDPKRSALPLAGLLDEAMSSIQNDVCTSQLASAVKTEPPLDSTEDDYEEISDNAESSNVTSKNQPEIDNEGNSTLSLTVYKCVCSSNVMEHPAYYFILLI